MSSVRSPSREPTTTPASCEPVLCGHTSPAASAASSTRSTCSASGRSGSGRPSTAPSRRRLSRTTIPGGSFCARISASASSAPSSAHHASATQSGYECRSAASGAVPSGSSASKGRRSRPSRRSTAFVNGTARSSRARRTSTTHTLTPAWSATTEKASWYAPSRSAARTGGSSLRTGRRPSVSMPWSSVRTRWIVPYASRWASGAVARVEPGRGGAERAVGVRLVLEDAEDRLVRRPAGRRDQRRPRRNSS